MKMVLIRCWAKVAKERDLAIQALRLLFDVTVVPNFEVRRANAT